MAELGTGNSARGLDQLDDRCKRVCLMAIPQPGITRRDTAFGKTPSPQ
jgi:hypothetical protein